MSVTASLRFFSHPLKYAICKNFHIHTCETTFKILNTHILPHPLLDCFLSTWVIIVLMAAQAHQSICDCGALAVRCVVNHYKSRLLSACVSLGPTVMCTNTHTHSVYSSLRDRVYLLKQTHNTHTHTHF